jgi:outer membrane protein OmpA-like peptidoglycan-associated protein
MVTQRVSLLAAVAVCVALTGCGGSDSLPRRSRSAPPSTSFQSAEKAPIWKRNSSLEDPWWITKSIAQPALPPAQPFDQTTEVSSDLLFAVNEDQLALASGSQLSYLRDLLKTNPSLTATITGHTDSTPGPYPAYNTELSLRRSSSIRDFFVAQGIDPLRIQTEGHGADEPMATNDTREGRAKNRRVTIRVYTR